MKERHFEFEGREAKVDEHYNILLKVADVAADLQLTPEAVMKDIGDRDGWILAADVFYVAGKWAKKEAFSNWGSQYALLERFIRSRMACNDALLNELVQTAAQMGRLQRLAMEYRGILAELDHEFKGKRVIFGKLVEAIDRELDYGARWFPGTVGKPVEYPEAASLGKAVGE